jgi:hypothetical protein
VESGAATGIKFDDPLHAEIVIDASEGNKIDLEFSSIFFCLI